jgi:formylglycine-generating enzyme required for sulfatase activity
MAKNLLISFFSLLLLAATAATAQETKPKLAVFVVGMDDWKRGDVVAHIVGEELNRDKTHQVVTRSGAVQVKLKQLRRSSGSVKVCELREGCKAHGVERLCLITSSDNQHFAAQLLDIANPSVNLCSGCSLIESFGAVDLKELAWSLTTQLSSTCPPPCSNYCEPLIEMDMIYVEGGTFRMGCAGARDGGIDSVSSGDNGECLAREEPDRDVAVGSFWIGKYEVTQAQWKAVMGITAEAQRIKCGAGGSLWGEGNSYPIYYVTWSEAVAFCSKLSALTGNTYRLPTQAEWEYAARGGRQSKGYKYSGSNDVNKVAWHAGNSGGGLTHPVGSLQANELGIYDMSGNVIEFCENYKVRNGGSYYSAALSRVAQHGGTSSTYCGGATGFRVV